MSRLENKKERLQRQIAIISLITSLISLAAALLRLLIQRE